LAVDSSEVEAIGILTAPDFGDYWTPDDAFFAILRDKVSEIYSFRANFAGLKTAEKEGQVPDRVSTDLKYQGRLTVSSLSS